MRRDTVNSRFSNTYSRRDSYVQRRDTVNSRMSNTYGYRETIMERRDSVASGDSNRSSLFNKFLGRTSVYQKMAEVSRKNSVVFRSGRTEDDNDAFSEVNSKSGSRKSTLI
jgi:hypothetical protein